MKWTLAILIFATGAHGANYYVDFSSGADSNNGTSTATPWKHCPGDPLATGNATSLASGDTVVFKGGVSYVVQNTGSNVGISLSFSGVTYDGNSSGAWGAGKAIITDNHATNGHIAFSGTVTRSNLTFKNFSIKELGGSSVLPSDGGSAVPPNNGWGIIFSSGTAASNINIQDCDFSELGYYFNQQPMDASSIDGCGLRFYDGKNLIVTNCNFSRMSIAAAIYCSTLMTNIIFANCAFSDSLRWCIDIAPTASNASMDFITVKNCTFYDYDQFDQQNWTGYGGWPHTDGIFHRSDYNSCIWGTNINFNNNFFYQTRAGGGGTASIYITEGPSANVFNNVFYYQGKTRVISLAGGPKTGGSPQVLRIYNNTFVDAFAPAIDWGISASPVVSGTGSLLSVLNNIFVDTYTNSAANFIFYASATNSGEITNMVFDHNIYSTGNLLGNFAFWDGVYGEGKLVSLRLLGWETNGLVANPEFVNLEGGNLHLQSGSPAIGAGETLASYFTTDKSGRTRTSWDIGAYEFAEEEAAPAATIPTHLRMRVR